MQFLSHKFKEFGTGSTTNPLIDIFLYSRHLSAGYCIDIVRRNSILVTDGSYKGLRLITKWLSMRFAHSNN